MRTKLKRRLSLIISIVVLFSLFPHVYTEAADTIKKDSRVFNVPKTSSSPKLDGNVDSCYKQIFKMKGSECLKSDGSWSENFPIDGNRNSLRYDAEEHPQREQSDWWNCTMTGYAAWDATYLYLIVDITNAGQLDDNPDANWAGDCFQIAVAKGDVSDIEVTDYTIAQDNGKIVAAMNLGNTLGSSINKKKNAYDSTRYGRAPSGYVKVSDKTNGNYTYELALEWTALGVKPSDKINFNCSVNLNDEDMDPSAFCGFQITNGIFNETDQKTRPGMAYAASMLFEGSIDGVYYEIENDHAVVTGCSDDITEIEIKSEYNSYPVTKIGDFAFEDKTALRNVTLPDSVISIGDGAFVGCAGLTSITIPDSVTSIGSGASSEQCAFSDCENLTIKTVKGSYADSYAQDHNIPVIYLNNFIPEAPTVSAVTETSVSLIPGDGFEYRMDDGEWQDSNIFENLDRNSSHSFYQRVKATASCLESISSPATVIRTKDHNYTAKIISPIPGKNGYTLYVCSLCGDSYKDNYTFYEGEDAPRIIVSSAVGIAGNKIRVAVSLENNPGIISMALKIEYDKNVLKLIEVSDCGILGDEIHKPTLQSPYYLNWVNDTTTENYTVNGNIVILTFEVLENAPLGKTPITVSYDCDNYEVYNVSAENVVFSIVNGYADIQDIELGDVNGDGVVNGYDRLLLTRWLAKWPEALEQGIIEATADVNCDGKVNNIDRLILTRHLAHWEGYATLPYTM